MLKETKIRGVRLPYAAASHGEIRELAALVIDMDDQIQEIFHTRCEALDLEMIKTLADLNDEA